MDFYFNRKELTTLRDALHPRIAEYKKGENILLSEKYFYILLSGIVYHCAEDELYERSILRFIRAGEPFSSETPLEIYNGIHYLNAKQNSTAAVFSHHELNLYLYDRPLWRERFNEVSEIGLKERTLKLNYILHRRTIRSRLLSFLRDESKIQQSDKIHIPIPFIDLADYLAVERTALMKEIGKMKSDGIISGKNRDIMLLV